MTNSTRRTGISRRGLLAGLGALGVFALLQRRSWLANGAPVPKETFAVNHSDAEWRAQLSPAQYDVLRNEGTERPNSSPLNAEKHHGVFACAGCANELFASETKFDSHTGWPSFYRPLANAVAERKDYSLGMERDEVHCRRCGGHLGHVFDDGPPPTGLRYCMNGVAMTFQAVA